MNARDGLIVGRQIVAERGINLTEARLAYKSMYPQVIHDMLETALILEIATLSELKPPFTVESVAEQLATQSGAFPWHGPVGNGMTLEYYQRKFRDIAREKLFLREVLGFTKGESADA